MRNNLQSFIEDVCRQHGTDRGRLMDVARGVQEEFGCISDDAIALIAKTLAIHRVEVESLVTFYSFFSKSPKGPIVIRLCDDIVDEMKGSAKVATALRMALGIDFGQTTSDGRITLEWTPCIGMCDQAPAALVDHVVVTHLDSEQVREMVQSLKDGATPESLVGTFGDGNNGHELVRAMVDNNIRERGPVVLAPFESGTALHKALAMSPAEVIRDVKTSRLRGRGGAGFPTGMKWDFTRQAAGDTKYVLCNADEGEPGTFKDRVILTECPDLLFEGMTIAGYAIGAQNGVVYLRGEYAYLYAFLDSILEERRRQGLLGLNAGGKIGFNFDIRIQMGAGAYVCGEETALISSCEGLRGDPKNRPPFPAQKGYRDCPTTVNNVETFCAVARIIDKGAGWFAQMGSKGSPGTKLLSVSGDCKRPGVYELPFGIKIRDLLKKVIAEDAAAVQLGGPSGRIIGPASFDRTICYDDMATGGAVVVFGPHRDLLKVALKYMEFFIEESCGYCTPCRVGNVLIRERLEKIIHGKADKADIEYLRELGRTVKLTSRCGLGQTSPNPVLTMLEAFPGLFEVRVRPTDDGFVPSFDIRAALQDAETIAGRTSTRY